MSLIRRVAKGISRFVVRRVSLGSKEWAEGLAREVDFVEGDWRALTWALGSVQVLFSYHEVPVRSLAELTAAAEKYAEVQRHLFGMSNARWLTSLIMALAWCVDFFIAKTQQDRIGYSLLVLGYVPLTLYELIQSRKEFDVPDRFDAAGMIQYYKAGLERVCNLLAPSFLIYAYSYTLITVGFGIVFRKEFLGVFSILLLVGFTLLFLQKRQNNLRRLEQIDALLRERR